MLRMEQSVPVAEAKPILPASIYTDGGTVQAGGGLYIKRKADDELFDLCLNSKFAYVLCSRQVGKSSLMVATAKRLKEEGVQTVIIDLTAMGTQLTAEQWYLGLLVIIAEQLDLKTDVVDWWMEVAHLGSVQRLMRFFQQVLLTESDCNTVIFVDEIDTTLGMDFTDDFFAAIRAVYNGRATDERLKRLSFVLLGVANPGDLIHDPNRTPFNIGERVNLTDFTLDEAKPLAYPLKVDAKQQLAILKRVMYWTGGHPYLTQHLMRVFAEKPLRKWSDAEIEKAVRATFFDQESERNTNLQFVRDMLTKRAPDQDQVLTLYNEILSGNADVLDEEQSLVKSHLKLCGVVVVENRALVTRNRIYRSVFDHEWIMEHLPKSLGENIEALNRLRSRLSFRRIAILYAGISMYFLLILNLFYNKKPSDMIFATKFDFFINKIIYKNTQNMLGAAMVVSLFSVLFYVFVFDKIIVYINGEWFRKKIRKFLYKILQFYFKN